MGWTLQGTLGSVAGNGGGGGGEGIQEGVAVLENIDLSTFYGFRFNPSTGRLVVEVKNGDEPVSLPDADIIRPLDYKNWVFTKRTLNFAWQLTEPSHLLMEVKR